MHIFIERIILSVQLVSEIERARRELVTEKGRTKNKKRLGSEIRGTLDWLHRLSCYGAGTQAGPYGFRASPSPFTERGIEGVRFYRSRSTLASAAWAAARRATGTRNGEQLT